MNFADVLITIFEVALVGVTLWALFHEDVLVDFEERVISRIRRRKLKVIKGYSSSCRHNRV